MENTFVRVSFLLFLLIIGEFSSAQLFIPMAFYRNKRQITVQCDSGCYPTPNTPFSASLYYLPIGYSATFEAISASNSNNYDFCWGPTPAGGCAADAFGGGVTYPLSCSAGTDSIDGSSVDNQADYAAATTATTSTCNVTDFNEGRAATTFQIQSFTAISITSPITTQVSPRNVCVGQTQAITGVGGIGTRTWSIISGGGSVSPTTGASTTYTAPITSQTVQVQLIDPTSQMTDIAYLNIISTISLSPAGTIEVVVNNSTNLFSTNTTTANLNMSANCGLQNYTCGVTGGGSVNPTAGIANNANVTYTPASSDSTSTVTFTDSTPVVPQTASLSIKNIVPVATSGSWYHTCVKYTHSTYTAGTYKAKCWGYNATGQIGVGTAAGSIGDAAAEMGYGIAFVKNTGTTGADMFVKEISAGFDHTCAILDDNSVKCWGGNARGQLGYDDTTTRSSPAASAVNLGGATPVKIYAGYQRTCVVFSDSKLKCWGYNVNGELGQDNTTNY